MKNLFAALAIGVVCLGLYSGCAMVRDSTRPRLAPVVADSGVVYLIHDMPAVGDAVVLANGGRLIALGGREYTWFYVVPGEYRYAICPLDPSWRGQAAAESTVKIRPGKNYYISVAWYDRPQPSVLEALAAPIVGEKPYHAHALLMLNETDAKAAMQRCRFVDPAR